MNYITDSITVSLGNSGKVSIQFSHLTWPAVCKDLGLPLTLEHSHIFTSVKQKYFFLYQVPKDPTYFLATFRGKQLLFFLEQSNGVSDPTGKGSGPGDGSSHWRMVLVQRWILEVLNKDLLNNFNLEENKILQGIIFPLLVHDHCLIHSTSSEVNSSSRIKIIILSLFLCLVELPLWQHVL